MLNKIEHLFLTRTLKEKLMHLLKDAGSRIHVTRFLGRNLLIAIAVNIALVTFLAVKLNLFENLGLANLIIIIISGWLVLFFVVFSSVMGLSSLMLHLRIYKRRGIVEDAFADFLQMTATNIRAGMSVDRALWSSIRPRFGDLAKEMEAVAKKTMSGTELTAALSEFADKYKSPLIRRSVSLIVQGAESGGRIADLLSNIALDIQETKLIKKEMTANVMSYIIFITATSIFIAPFLFALSSQLISIMVKISSNIDISAAQSAAANMPISFSGNNVSLSDFRIFAYCCLGITSFFSAIIVSIISKGNIKSGLKFIPIFMAVSLSLFVGFSYLLNMVFSSFF